MRQRFQPQGGRTDSQTGSCSVTDPAGLAAFIGPGTLPYTVDQSSQGDVVQVTSLERRPTKWAT